jgi:hypothetical protein
MVESRAAEALIGIADCDAYEPVAEIEEESSSLLRAENLNASLDAEMVDNLVVEEWVIEETMNMRTVKADTLGVAVATIVAAAVVAEDTPAVVVVE